MPVSQQHLNDFRRTVQSLSDHQRHTILTYLDALAAELVDGWLDTQGGENHQSLRGQAKMLRALRQEFEAPARVEASKLRKQDRLESHHAKVHG